MRGSDTTGLGAAAEMCWAPVDQEEKMTAEGRVCVRQPPHRQCVRWESEAFVQVISVTYIQQAWVAISQVCS